MIKILVAALLGALAIIGIQPPAAATSQVPNATNAVINDDDSTRSVKIYKSANCYDNPNIVDTKILAAGTTSEAWWTRVGSFRVFEDTSGVIYKFHTDTQVATWKTNVIDHTKGVCYTKTGSYEYRVYQYPGIA